MNSIAIKVAAAFVAGFLATLVFHQGLALAFYVTGLAPNPPFNMAPRPPLGVPAVFSLAFWGGIWGLLLAALEPRFGTGARYWTAVALFGAVLPTLAIWVVVQPLRGAGVFSNVTLAGSLRLFALNAAWGVGTALFYRLAPPRIAVLRSVRH